MSTDERRTTADLVDELNEEAKGHTVAALAVGFKAETTFVFSTDPNSLDTLNGYVQAGGEPLGILVFDSKTGEGSARPLREYQTDEFVEQHLITLLANFIHVAAEAGIEVRWSR